MKHLLITIACLCLLGAAPSCAVYHGLVDPKVNVQVSSWTVQGAEHTLRAAKDTFDLFFGLVHDNHAFVVANLPQVYAFAQTMQTKAPDALRKANAAKNAFKYSRTTTNQTDLNTIMATIASLMLQTQGYVKEIQITSH